ncbi:MAG: protein kinase [Gemmatimonadetes bacterium]|nr:protein kinase [Gemmatimonadota bacterium]
MHIPIEDVQQALGDRYEVLDLAGAGGMGAVFRARHRVLGHLVAVKLLPPEVAASTMLQERFKREASLAAHLSHPNIVPVYEFDVRAGLSFLIMPYVRGRTLESMVRERGRFRPADVLRVIREVGAALEFAHARNVVHRDVKPSNILIEEEHGRALLTDFGVAHVPHTVDTALTGTGVAIGTPAYMAPEQLAGSGAVDGRADLYALALTAFEALTGTRPGVGADHASLARALRAASPELPVRVATVLVAPLAERPEDRPPSVGVWLDRVDASAKRRPLLPAASAGLLVAAAIGWAVWSRGGAAPEPVSSLAVFPFSVLRPPPDLGPVQLTEFFANRLGSVEDLRILSPAKVAARAGTGALAISDAQALAQRLNAKYFLFGNVTFSGPGVRLTSTLYEVRSGRVRGEGEASGLADSLPSVMDAAAAQVVSGIVGETFARTSAVTLPRSLPALVAYASGEDAFRRGDYERALAEYERVITHDSTFAVAYFRRALVLAQIAPSEESFQRELARALAGAERQRAGLAPADSLLLEGYRLLFQQGDGRAAAERFKQAADRAPDQAHVWFVLGEFYLYAGSLFGQRIGDAERAFAQVLDLSPMFAPALANSISLAHLRGDDQETRRLIRTYQTIDSTSVVAEVVGIADTLLFGSPGAKLYLLNRTLDRRDFIILMNLAFQAAQYGTEAERQGPGRRILDALERRASTDWHAALALRMALAADLRAGMVDNARLRLGRARPAAARERDVWIVLAQAVGFPPLGDWKGAGARLSRDTAAAAHWLLARAGFERERHASALARLAAADSAPLPVSLARDLEARNAVAAGDTVRALALWEAATQRYAVLRVPFDLVASLWPIRLDLIRLALAHGDLARAEHYCGSFGALQGYVDQMALPEISRVCARWREAPPPASPG